MTDELNYLAKNLDDWLQKRATRTVKRASYKNGVAWIAEMDESAEMDPHIMSGVPSVILLAELFGKDPLEVAKAIIRKRTETA